jgi:hypothetical protein
VIRRSKYELKELINEAHQQLEIIDSLPKDTYTIGTYLEFIRYDSKWLTIKTENEHPEGNNLWYSYNDATLLCWEQLFPDDLLGLSICMLVSTPVWEDRKPFSEEKEVESVN